MRMMPQNIFSFGAEHDQTGSHCNALDVLFVNSPEKSPCACADFYLLRHHAHDAAKYFQFWRGT
jgi:hypothetical protein